MFDPKYVITAEIAKNLMRIEAAKEKAILLPVNPIVIASLRESAKLITTHYSTMIEGNRLAPDEVKEAVEHKGHFPGRERDEKEVKGYYAALEYLDRYIASEKLLSEQVIQTLHALVMSDGKIRVKPSAYRDGQNVIRDGSSGNIVYLPPEAPDVPSMMSELVSWVNHSQDLPIPIVAAIAHYQFATIHPYYDGNGRTARLLTTLILHQGGYDLKGLFSLEEYYARNLPAYYREISVGPSHNYYMGRKESEITDWIEYFVFGVAVAFENVTKQMEVSSSQNLVDRSPLMKRLSPKQRKLLSLFHEYDEVTTSQVRDFFGFSAKVASNLCRQWVKEGFIEIANPSNKARSFRLSKKYRVLAE